MRFWRFEINWLTPQKEEFSVHLPSEWPFPSPVKKPTVKKATTRKPKDENKKPKRTTKT